MQITEIRQRSKSVISTGSALWRSLAATEDFGCDYCRPKLGTKFATSDVFIVDKMEKKKINNLLVSISGSPTFFFLSMSVTNVKKHSDFSLLARLKPFSETNGRFAVRVPTRLPFFLCRRVLLFQTTNELSS